jgi:hypothetical protein
MLDTATIAKHLTDDSALRQYALRKPQWPYAELALRLFGTTPKARLVAFTSANRGEGISHVIAGLRTELARIGRRASVVAGAECLGVVESRLHNRYREVECMLLDCGSLEETTIALEVGHKADGVVLVVEAGRTSKHDVSRAIRLITQAGATVLGCVLNKRRYPIPGWLYRML